MMRRSLTMTLLLGLALVSVATAAQADPQPRRLRWNGKAATAAELGVLAQLELRWGQRVPDGDYWYDRVSGAAGAWGGPMSALLPPGLALGGPLPDDASGGGTGVFINRRELHPLDVQRLAALLGPVYPGRYWVDAYGNAGLEGGPPLLNLYQLARQRGGASPWSLRMGGASGRSGDSISGASDGQTTCFSTGGRTVCTDGNN
jgi:hypothetical protein